MKPKEARARRAAAAREREAAGERLTAFLAGGGDRSQVVPELIPDDADHVAANRAVRQLIRQAERQPRGAARTRKVDELIAAMARLVFVERVMALDALERAGLTPARLVVMARVREDDLHARLRQMKGETDLVVVEEGS